MDPESEQWLQSPYIFLYIAQHTLAQIIPPVDYIVFKAMKLRKHVDV